MEIQIDQEAFNKSFDDALKGIAIDVETTLKNKLTKEHGKDTGIGQTGIKANVVGNTIEIDFPKHLMYVEFGTAPHMPPVEALEGWAQRKLGDKNLAWALALHIKKYGTTPHPFIRNTFDIELGPIIKNNLLKSFK